MATSQIHMSHIPATEARRQLGDILRRVHSGREHIVIVKDGLPAAVMISPPEYELLKEYQAQRQMSREERMEEVKELAAETYDKARHLGLSEEELFAYIRGFDSDTD